MSSEKQNTARARWFRVTGHHLFVVKQIGASDFGGRVPACSELASSSNKTILCLLQIYHDSVHINSELRTAIKPAHKRRCLNIFRSTFDKILLGKGIHTLHSIGLYHAFSANLKP
jgi:hypothetical protein